MKPGTTIWDKLITIAGCLLFVASIGLVGMWYVPLIHQNERMRKVIHEQETQIQQALAEERQMKAAADALRNDPRTVERLARERLGYARPGETVIRFEGATTNTPSAVTE